MSAARELGALVGVPVDHTDALRDPELHADATCTDCRGHGWYHRVLCACVTRRPVPVEHESGVDA